MKSPRVTPLEVRPTPSWRLAALLASLHVLAGGAVLASGLTTPLRVLLVLALGAALAGSLRRHVWRHDVGAVVAFRVGEGGAVTAELRSGRILEGRVAGETVAHPALVILRIVTEAGRRTTLIAPDTLDPETFRRLRLRLRWMRPQPGRDGPPAGAAP